MLGEVGVDLPRPCGVGIGQGVARDGIATQSHVIEPLGLCARIYLDVAQRFAVGQRGKSHVQKLIHAGEVLDFAIAAVPGCAPAKSTQWQKGHELKKISLPWFMVILCVCAQRKIKYGVDAQIETRLKIQKAKVNH